MSSGFDYQALYLHIPFCAKRCNYCDFVTVALAYDDPQLDDYTDWLIGEIHSAEGEGLLTGIKSIYIGGGTPSFLGHRRLVNLVDAISCSVPRNQGIEFSFEANPESLDAAMLHDLISKGVNRVSIGVQSFDDSELAILGRVHNADRARAVIKEACEQLENVSIDLMCGIPGQSESSWSATLNQAVQSGISHVSVYPLTIEEGTPFAQMVAEGQMSVPDEDAQADFMEMAADMLTGAGFARYEVASYSRPGFECRHNSAYWTGVPYLGLGRGAAGMRETGQCRERLFNGEVIERLEAPEAIREDIMLGMRMSKGVAFELVEKAMEFVPGMADTFEELIALGLVRFEDGHYRPTSRGWLLGNELYGRIWSA